MTAREARPERDGQRGTARVMEEPAVRQRRLKRERYALNIAKTGRVVNQSLGRRRVDEQLRVASLLAEAGRVITFADRAIRDMCMCML